MTAIIIFFILIPFVLCSISRNSGNFIKILCYLVSFIYSYILIFCFGEYILLCGGWMLITFTTIIGIFFMLFLYLCSIEDL